MAQVTLNLYATFRQCVGGQAVIQVDIEPGQTIGEMLTHCRIPLERVHIVFCNHRLVDLMCRLEGGEMVGVFPAVGGG